MRPQKRRWDQQLLTNHACDNLLQVSARTDTKPGSLQNPHSFLLPASGLLSLWAGSPQRLNLRGVTSTQALSAPRESPDGLGHNSLNVLGVHWFLQASEASSLLSSGHLCDIVSFTLTDKDDFKVRYSAYKNSAATQTQALISWFFFLFNFPDWRLKT